ncbi:uncharacterized protein LOC143345676 [Colletes latitarsis]|uniref:uncharacterized protein LOC143345676 n=1 Tax=Colletes latitarsis TaxID=2605962 RepID=UPI0040369D8D
MDDTASQKLRGRTTSERGHGALSETIDDPLTYARTVKLSTVCDFTCLGRAPRPTGTPVSPLNDSSDRGHDRCQKGRKNRGNGGRIVLSSFSPRASLVTANSSGDDNNNSSSSSPGVDDFVTGTDTNVARKRYRKIGEKESNFFTPLAKILYRFRGGLGNRRGRYAINNCNGYEARRLAGAVSRNCIGILEGSRTRDTCDFGLEKVNTRSTRWRETPSVHRIVEAGTRAHSCNFVTTIFLSISNKRGFSIIGGGYVCINQSMFDVSARGIRAYVTTLLQYQELRPFSCIEHRRCNVIRVSELSKEYMLRIGVTIAISSVHLEAY